jgi:hypothetical protein
MIFGRAERRAKEVVTMSTQDLNADALASESRAF